MAGEDQPPKLARRQAGHLGRDPAAEAEPNQAHVVQPQLRQQPLVDGGHIAHTAHPERTVGDAEAGVSGDVDRRRLRQRLVEGQPAGIADVVMQHERRGARPAFEEGKAAAGHLDGLFGPGR
ncbi:MAG: hypothetical protein U0531_13145 [Dehalococcoidia bacterium]